MTTYTTVQGDMFDGIAYKVYGDASKVAELIGGNTQYRDIQVFPEGVELVIPDITKTETAAVSAVVPVWRT